MTTPQSPMTGHWVEARGNYSGGSIRWTDTPGARVTCTYSANGDHWLYLGTRLADHGGQVTVQVDGGTPVTLGLAKAAEDVLVRVPIAAVSGQAQHTVTITHTGANGTVVYFDFLEIAYPSATLPDFERNVADDTGDRLGHGPFAGDRTGANGVADPEAGISRPGESLRRGDVVLRTVPAGAQLCERHDHIFRHTGIRQEDAGIPGTDADRAPESDWRHGGEHRDVLRAADQCGLHGRLGASGRRGADDHVAADGVGRQRDGNQREHKQHGVHGSGKRRHARRRSRRGLADGHGGIA